MTPARRAGATRRQRAAQATTASTAAALLVALVVGAGAGDDARAGEAPVVVAGHHGSTVLPARPVGDAGTAPAVSAAGPASGGRTPHDHGELEVTVMLGAGGTTRVRRPVGPGGWYSLVNHTEDDQLLTTADGALRVEVPLQRLVTLPAPAAAGTYRLVSTTDPTVVAELVVRAPSA